MTHWVALVSLAGVIVVIAVVMVVLWRLFYAPVHNQRDEASDAEKDDVMHLLREATFERVCERTLFGAQVIFGARSEGLDYRLDVEQCRTSLEDASYTRLVCVFDEGLKQGVEMYCEEGAGMFGWFLSLQEVDIEDDFTEYFILKGRDEVRLKQLISSACRAPLLSLRQHADDVQLTDSGVFVGYRRALSAPQLRQGLALLDDALDAVLAFCREHGPIDALQGARYGDAIAEMDMDRMRQDAASEAEALGDEATVEPTDMKDVDEMSRRREDHDADDAVTATKGEGN